MEGAAESRPAADWGPGRAGVRRAGPGTLPARRGGGLGAPRGPPPPAGSAERGRVRPPASPGPCTRSPAPACGPGSPPGPGGSGVAPRRRVGMAAALSGEAPCAWRARAFWWEAGTGPPGRAAAAARVAPKCAFLIGPESLRAVFRTVGVGLQAGWELGVSMCVSYPGAKWMTPQPRLVLHWCWLGLY